MNRFLSIEERVARFRRFYERRNERPLLGFFVGSEYPLQRYDACRSLPVHRPLRPEDFEVEPYLDDCDHLFELHESCGGDFIWSGSAFWGVPWLEVALGCSIRADHSTGSIYSEPPPDFRGPDDLPAFDARSPWMVKAVEFIHKMASRSRGRWPIGTTRMRGISDLLSALYGGTEFVFAMMERPDEVKIACERLTEFWIEFGRLQLRHIPPFEGGIGSFYYNIWAPAGTVWHQEDAAALLSPRLYDAFIRECDERIVAAFDGCIMHQHPTKFVPTDFYRQMPFKALELHIDKGGPTAQELHARYLRILDRMPLLIWGQLSPADLDWIFERLPGAGLAVMTVVDNTADAAEIWKRWMVAEAG
jgi:hypothetical protein